MAKRVEGYQEGWMAKGECGEHIVRKTDLLMAEIQSSQDNTMLRCNDSERSEASSD